MPRYKSNVDQKEYDIEDWPGHSYKARVINRAFASGEFWVQNFLGDNVNCFQCFWCKRWNPSAAIEGDHVVQQQCGRGDDPELKSVWEEAEGQASDWNLVLSCSECNGGSRNKQKIMTRGAYQKDRKTQDPRPIS